MGHYGSAQVSMGQDWSDRVRKVRTAQARSVQISTGQVKTAQDRSGQDRLGQDRSAWVSIGKKRSG